jgi:cyclic pyranopterin phosphate synthase
MKKKTGSFTHLDRKGGVRMVDLSGKSATVREAVAEAVIRVGPSIAGLLRDRGEVTKGNVFETARIAGILAGKRTPEIIPLCHPLPIDRIDVELELRGVEVRIRATAKTEAKTGVEMECMVAAGVAALTVYDMCKSAGKGIEIVSIRLLEKSGGKSGHWKR